MSGTVAQTVGMTISVAGFPAETGRRWRRNPARRRDSTLLAEVIGFRNEHTLLYPFSDLAGIRPGDPRPLVAHRPAHSAWATSVLGRVKSTRRATPWTANPGRQ